MQVDVRDNIKQVLARMEGFSRDVVEKATVSALNRVADQAVTQAAREIRDKGYNFKAARIKAAIRVIRASTGKLTASVRVKRKPTPLIDFDARETRKGVTVKVQGKRAVIPHAFIATMPSGHRGVFVRKDGGTHLYKRKGGRIISTQLPIRELYGPSIGAAYANDAIQEAMARSIASNFEARLRHEIKRLSR